MNPPIPEDNTRDNIDNINNIMNINNKEPTTTTNIEIFQHFPKDSIIPLDKDNKSKNFKQEEENDTVVTKVGFLQDDFEKGNPINQLNKSLEKTDDTSKNSTKMKEDIKEETNLKNETFLQKTKRWAGNVWSYINIANYFPKTEYKEYRNANGDWVKIPVKKIPLKKKINKEETEEEHIINKTVDRDRGQLAYLTGDRIPIPNFY